MVVKLYQFAKPVLVDAYKKQIQDCIEQINRRTDTLKSFGKNSSVIMTQEEADLIIAVADKIKDALAILHEPKE